MRRLLALVVLAIVGVGLSAASWWWLTRAETDRINLEFTSEVNKRASALEREIELQYETLYRWKSFYESYGELPFAQFQAISQDVIKRHPGITAVAWAPRVPGAARHMVESQLQLMDPRLMFLDVDIDAVKKGGIPIRPAAVRDEYFPIMMVEPMQSTNFMLGLDVGSDPVRQMDIGRARQSGDIEATEVFPSPFTPQHEAIFAAYVPIYAGNPIVPQDRLAQTKGLIMASFRIDSVVEKSGMIDGLARGIRLELRDESNESLSLGGALRTAYMHTAGLKDADLRPEFSYKRPLKDMAGRKWALVATPGRVYFEDRLSNQPKLAFVFGVALTLLTILYIRLMQQRTQVVEALVEERTRELNEANRQLERMTRTDGLTRVANRRYFDEYLDQEWKRAVRSNTPLTLILIDIDHFKRYNDHYGHIEGDHCLQAVAQALASAVARPGDLVARYGGEEFAIILPNTGDESRIVADRCRETVENLNIPHGASTTAAYVTISVGLSYCIPTRDMVSSQLVKAADEGLYKAKGAGRNQVSVNPLGPV